MFYTATNGGASKVELSPFWGAGGALAALGGALAALGGGSAALPPRAPPGTTSGFETA